MENPETPFPPLNQFNKKNKPAYTKFIDKVILWGFDLSPSFKSYQDYPNKAKILLQNNGREMMIATHWNKSKRTIFIIKYWSI